METKVDLLIIGGGPAGLSAGIRAKELGIGSVLVVEQGASLGGILNQCIHNGFGLHTFKEELTGPEYAHRLIQRAEALEVPTLLETTVVALSKEKVARLQSPQGIWDIEAQAVILAMGSRERPRGAIQIPGTRPAGVFSAGSAQELVNLQGHKIGNEAVIVGSGDIGLIMARRLTLEGTKVLGVVEKMPHSSGLRRNMVQCLDDFGIPLHLNHTVSRIFGHERVEGVNIAKVENGKIVPDSERFVACDTVLFSVGLIPENELSLGAGIALDRTTKGAVVDSHLETSVAGIFACGNALHVHDLVDNVSLEAYEAVRHVKAYLDGDSVKKLLPVEFDGTIRYVVPQSINAAGEMLDTQFKFRASSVFKNVRVSMFVDGENVFSRHFRVITPGELETVVVKQPVMERVKTATNVVLKIEEG